MVFNNWNNPIFYCFSFLLITIVSCSTSFAQRSNLTALVKNNIHDPCGSLDSIFSVALNESDSTSANILHQAIIKGDRLVPLGREDLMCWNRQLSNAIKWDKKNLSNDTLIAEKLTLLGINQKFLGITDNALIHLKEAKKLKSKYLQEDNKEIIVLYQNIAECYYLQKKYQESLRYLNTAYNIIGQHSLNDSKARCFKNYAAIYAEIGDTYLYKVYNQAYKPYLEKKNPNDLPEYFINFARGLSLLGEYEQSSKVLDELESNYSDKPTKIFHKIKSYNFDKLGQVEDAIIHWDAIEQIKNGSVSRIEILQNRILKYSGRNNKHLAYSFMDSLEKLALVTENYSALNMAYDHKIIHFLKEDKLLEAYEYLKKQKLLIFKEKKMKFQSNYTESIHFRYALELLSNLGKSEDHKYYYEAYDMVKKLDSLTRIKIESYTADNMDETKLGTKMDLYLKGIEICKILYKLSQDEKYLSTAVDLLEQNKAIILIKHAKEKINSTLSQNLNRENNIKDSLETEMNICNDKRKTLEAKLKAANKLHKLASELLDLNEKKILDFKNLKSYDYSEIDVGNPKLIFVSTTTGFYRIFIDAAVRLFDHVEFTASDKKQLNGVITYCNNINYEHDQKIEKISNLLLPEEVHNVTDLIIFTDGALSDLPFEILKINGKRLIEQTNISYAYSLQHLATMSQRKKSYSDIFTTFAPTYTDKQVYTTRNDNLGNLLYNIPEVEAIKNYFPSATNHTGTNASLSSFMTEAPNANILHIAAHAKSDTTEAGCHIYFSDDQDNYTLSLSDIYKMTIPAELVTLSACETATGEHLAGEGVLSLARGFAYAGAKSVVSSLWSANDESTSMIMSSFYKYLSDGMRKDVALRQAKLDFLANTDSEYHHPYYWAAFIPVGDMTPIVQSTPYKVYALAAMLLGGLGIGLRKKLKITA